MPEAFGKKEKNADMPEKKILQWLRDEKYGGAEPPVFFDDIQRLTDGEPLDYVIGFAEFLGCRIDLSRRPFIPRPETEVWVKQAIAGIRQHSHILTCPEQCRRKNVRMLRCVKEIWCLDLFAGSGCIGISVLKHVPDAHVDFVEIDERLLEQIRMNAELNSIPPDRYRIVRSDVFSGVRGRYDYIFVNPPYIAESRKKQVQKSVINWEPHGALFGGVDGLFYLKRIISEAPRHLTPRGKLYFEFDAPQKKPLERIVAASKYRRSKFYKDQYGVWRYAICER